MNRKVLILSRGFRAGDAITTLNLFSQWPKTDLYCASMLGTEFASNFNEFYVLGSDEIQFRFPFTYLASVGKSHIADTHEHTLPITHQKKSLKRSFYEKILLPVLQRFDLYETRFQMQLSDNLIHWIEKIAPDVIYTSIGDVPMAHFILDVHNCFPNIKIAVHCFDDWLIPTYKIINETKHREQGEVLLRKIISIASYRFTSSDKMALEYKNRYGYTFKCFPNPVRINIAQGEVQKSSIPNIVFAGKIGWHNNLAIKDMIAGVEKLNREGIKIQFDIYSDCTQEQRDYFLGATAESTVFHDPLPNAEILKVLAAAHILFLPISITEQTEKFTRYSMSTKMGEYLSTGVPTIYCGPSSIAMTEFLKAKNCAIVVEKPGVENIEKAVLKALDKSVEIDDMCRQGIDLAYSYFNMDRVSHDFTLTLQQNG